MTNNSGRITKREWLEEIKVVVLGADIEEATKSGMMDFINHEIELLEKKHSTGQTKTQKENEIIMERILELLAEVNEPVTITELQEQKEELRQYSNQKMSALLKKLVDSGKVVKTIEKKKSYFSLA